MSKILVQRFPELLKFSGSVAAACDMTGSMPCAGYSQLVGYITSSGSLDGTVGLSVQQSVNGGSVWDIISASQVSATAFTTSCMIDIIGDAIRVRSKNGATKTSNLRMLFQLKPVAGTAKMPDVDVDVVTSIAEITSGSVTVTSGSLDELKSGSVVVTSGSIDILKSGSVVVTSASIDILKSGSVCVSSGSGVITSGSIDILKSGSVVMTSGSITTIASGSVDIAGALPAGTNIIGKVQPFDVMATTTAIPLVEADDAVITACQFGKSASVTFSGVQSGEFLSTTFLYSPTGGTADNKIPGGLVYFFSSCPTITAGCTSVAASDYANVYGRVELAATDWDKDSACYGGAFICDQPVPFPAASRLWFAYKQTTAACFNDAAGDDEKLDMLLTYRRDS